MRFDGSFKATGVTWYAAAQNHPIEALSPALCPPARLGLQDSSLSTPLVYVASGPHEICLWDVEQSKCHQVEVF